LQLVEQQAHLAFDRAHESVFVEAKNLVESSREYDVESFHSSSFLCRQRAASFGPHALCSAISESKAAVILGKESPARQNACPFVGQPGDVTGLRPPRLK
jgi:hypothetical protein